jgi:hypothetical protein
MYPQKMGFSKKKHYTLYPPPIGLIIPVLCEDLESATGNLRLSSRVYTHLPNRGELFFVKNWFWYRTLILKPKKNLQIFKNPQVLNCQCFFG